VFAQFEATDGVEVLQLGSSNDVIDAKGGNDTLIGENFSTCRELKIANNVSTCSLHVEQNKEKREIA